MHLVLVHLGSRPSPLLKSNIARLKVLFPGIQLVVISDSKSRGYRRNQMNIKVFPYSSTAQRPSPDPKSGRSMRFRQGFWQLTFERLLAVTSYHSNNPTARVLHIETDVLLFPNFPFEILRLFQTPTWCNYNQDRDVASLLYLPNFHSSEWLRGELLKQLEANVNVSDMEALSNISRTHPTKVAYFPSLTEKLRPVMLNVRNLGVDGLSCKLPTIKSNLEGIFDSAAIGMWLCGLDPENHYGRLIRHDRGIIDSGDSLIDPSKLAYRMDRDGNLFVQFQETITYIYSLHIHSKRKELFSSHWKHELEKDVDLSKDVKTLTKTTTSLALRVFLLQLHDGNLVRYLLSFPKIYPYVKRVRDRVRNFLTL